MPISPGTAMAIGGVLDFAGGLFGRSGGGKAARQQLHHQMFLDDRGREWQDKWNKAQLDFATRQYEEQFGEQKRIQRERIRDAVTDAKAAGLHPLYALGASGGSSPVSVSFMPGQSGTGSAVGAGIRKSGAQAALRGLAQGARAYGAHVLAKEDRAYQRESRALELERQRLQNTSLGWEVYNQQHAALKTAEANSNIKRPSPTPEDVRGAAGTGGIPEEFRKKETGAWYDWVKMPSGKYEKVLSSNWDEISQAHMIWKLLKDKFDIGPTPRRGSLRGKVKRPLVIRINKARGGSQ